MSKQNTAKKIATVNIEGRTLFLPGELERVSNPRAFALTSAHYGTAIEVMTVEIVPATNTTPAGFLLTVKVGNMDMVVNQLRRLMSDKRIARFIKDEDAEFTSRELPVIGRVMTRIHREYHRDNHEADAQRARFGSLAEMADASGLIRASSFPQPANTRVIRGRITASPEPVLV